MSEHTEQDTSSRRLWSNVLISMSSSKRSEKGFRGTQLETMKSCDFLYAFLRILAVYYDNFFHCRNQSGPLFFIDVLRFVIGRNATEAHPVSLAIADQQKPVVPPPGLNTTYYI